MSASRVAPGRSGNGALDGSPTPTGAGAAPLSRPLRVLLVGHSYVSVELGQAKARELARRPGLEVVAVAPARFFELGHWMRAERPADPPYRLEVLPVALPQVRGQRHAYFYPRGLARLVRRMRPDVIDLWEEPYTAASAQVAVLRRLVAPRARLVLNPSKREPGRTPVPFRQGERLVVHAADYVVGRSPEAVAALRAKGYRGPGAVIGHGIELGLLGTGDAAVARRELGLPAGAPLVAYVGRLVPDKGVDVLLEAVARRPEPLHVLVAGRGPDEPALRAQARRLGLDGRAHFIGPLPMERVGTAFRAADVVAMPSRHEPWGRVAVEAMACGVPLVAGAAGHLPALVDGHGLLVPPGDAPALADALGAALHEAPEARRRRVEGALRHAHGFSWAALAERWEAVYREVTA